MNYYRETSDDKSINYPICSPNKKKVSLKRISNKKRNHKIIHINSPTSLKANLKLKFRKKNIFPTYPERNSKINLDFKFLINFFKTITF